MEKMSEGSEKPILMVSFNSVKVLREKKENLTEKPRKKSSKAIKTELKMFSFGEIISQFGK